MALYPPVWEKLRPQIEAAVKRELGPFLAKSGPRLLKQIRDPKYQNVGTNRFLVAFESLIDHAGRQAQVRYGLKPAGQWDVRNSLVYRAIEQAQVQLCNETRAEIEQATLQEADRVISQMKTELLAGQKKGESAAKITNRIAQFFSQESRWRARRIARTEAARAHNYGFMAGVEDFDEVTGWEWHLSSDACPRCMAVGMVKGRPRRVRKGVPFATDPAAPAVYGTILAPPLHPNCFCSILPTLDIDGLTDKDFDGTFKG